jgi:glycosyltransferase involved in cell wall biosynthesis
VKVLVAHNFYQQPGGEDAVFRGEIRLLRDNGNEVIDYVRHNAEINSFALTQFAALPARTLWNWDSYAHLKRILVEHRPDVAHFHNTFPLISPAAYHACWDAGVPVVQSLHNSRLFCPSGGLFYSGSYCERCLGKSFPWAGVSRACYRNSHIQTGVVGLMTAAHRKLGTWNEKVARYVVFNSFFRQKFIQAGLPAEKIVIKPHFIDDPGRSTWEGNYALYVGRLSEAKGVLTLLHAAAKLPHVPIKLCGAGGVEPRIQQALSQLPRNVEILPFAPREKVLDLMKGAAFLIWPSEALETFGLVAIEAFACGRAVISSGLGAMLELVQENRTGVGFRAGDPEDLAEKIAWAWSHPGEMSRMGQVARGLYEANYSSDRNYSQLMQIYHEASCERSMR